MKILHLYTDLNITCGITSVIKNIVLFNGPDKFEHFVAVTGGDALSHFRQKGINVKLLSFGSSKIFCPFLIVQLIIFCRKNEINIIHSHHRYMDFISIFVRMFCTVKILTTVHSIVKGKKILSYRIPEIVAVSDSVRRYLIDYFNVPPEKIRVIHNSVYFNPQELVASSGKIKEALDIHSCKKVICYVGRFDLDKGVDVLLHSIKLLKSRRNDFVLIMVGDGCQYDWIKQFIKKNSLPVFVMAPGTNILEYYQLADVVVLPSRVDTFPMAMLEAGFMQKAFVGSRVYGIEEFIEHNIDGLLVESEDVLGFTLAVELLMDDNKLGNRLALNLYNKVKQGYQTEHKIPLYNNLYREIY